MRVQSKNIAKTTGIALLSVFLIFPLAAIGQEDADSTTNTGSRFSIERDGEAFVRLDKKTGETSYCRSTNNNLICKLAIEERDTFHEEISSLQKELSAAQEKLDAIGDEQHSELRPRDDVPDTTQDENAGSGNDKFERELDKAMDITKLTMRRLFKIVKELQKEFGDEL